MNEQILYEGEKVELEEQECQYCGGGATASLKSGDIVLTDRRLIICKNSAGLQNGITTGLIAGCIIILPVFTGGSLGVIPAMLLGGVIGAVVHGVFALISKAKGKSKNVKIAQTFERGSIESVGDGSRGLNRNMLTVTMRGGEVCKIGVKNKEQWRAALLRG